MMPSPAQQKSPTAESGESSQERESAGTGSEIVPPYVMGRGGGYGPGYGYGMGPGMMGPGMMGPGSDGLANGNGGRFGPGTGMMAR